MRELSRSENIERRLSVYQVFESELNFLLAYAECAAIMWVGFGVFFGMALAIGLFIPDSASFIGPYVFASAGATVCLISGLKMYRKHRSFIEAVKRGDQ